MHITGLLNQADKHLFCYVITKNGKTLESVLNFIKSINGISLTRTYVVLSTNKCEVSLLPDKEN